MFDSSDSPFFNRRGSRFYRRERRSTYDVYESSSPFSSFEDMSEDQLMIAPPSPLGWRTYTRIVQPSASLAVADLPSRINALNRRGATLSTFLSHLSAVMEPLRSAKAHEMSELELRDVLREGAGVSEAMHDFEERYDEVCKMLRELMVEKRDVARKLQGGKGSGRVNGPPKGY